MPRAGELKGNLPRAGYYKRIAVRLDCPTCGEKYREGQPCYTCAAAKKKGERSVSDVERDERIKASQAPSHIAAAIARTANRRAVTVDVSPARDRWVEYEIVWDGSMDGPQGVRVLVQ